MLDESSARAWCEALAGGLDLQRITRDGQPYLERYFAAGWSPEAKQPGPAVFLHHFVASDSAITVHSHPWGWSSSLILVGGYREERCAKDGSTTVREYRPGDVNILTAEDKHRIDLLGADCWTLFMAGHFSQPWAFQPQC